jgi:Tol biopolymer transport system component
MNSMGTTVNIYLTSFKQFFQIKNSGYKLRFKMLLPTPITSDFFAKHKKGILSDFFDKFATTPYLILFLISLFIALSSNSNAQDFTSENTKRISQSTLSGGGQSTGASSNALMSKSGRFIAFESILPTGGQSPARHLDPVRNVTRGRRHVYLYDRQAESVELASLTLDGAEAPVDCYDPAVSNDGRYVAFICDSLTSANVEEMVEVCQSPLCHLHRAYGGRHVYVRDRKSNWTLLASQLEVGVAFQVGGTDSPAFDPPNNFVDENNTNIRSPLMAFDHCSLSPRLTRRVAAYRRNPSPGQLLLKPDDFNVTTFGATSANPRFSSDGRYLVYDTDADNLVWSCLDESIAVSSFYFPRPQVTAAGSSPFDYLEQDGNRNDGDLFVNIAGSNLVRPDNFLEMISGYSDTNDVRDVIMRDGEEKQNKLLTLFCKFNEPGRDCVPVRSTVDSINADISTQGNFIVFESAMPFLELDFNGVSDIFVVERTGFEATQEISTLKRISNNKSRIVAANGSSTNPAISGNGRFIAYQSTSSDLAAVNRKVEGDSSLEEVDANSRTDVFVYDRDFDVTVMCSKARGLITPNATPTPNSELPGALPTPRAFQGNADSIGAQISGSGEFIAFTSAASNFGVASSAPNAYVARIKKGKLGELSDCVVNNIASAGVVSGTSFTGVNQFATVSGVGLSPKSVFITGTAGNLEKIRINEPIVSYFTAANDAVSSSSSNNGPDTNGVSDVFQTPICSQIDLETDTDGDGTVDCFDQCWKDGSKVESPDSDGDGVADCEDQCIDDSTKSAPGPCGCGVPEVNTDGDFLTDGTQSWDCIDKCPTDPLKQIPGVCGCGNSDVDSNQNGVADCKDLAEDPDIVNQVPTPTPNTPGGVPVPSPTPTIGGNRLPRVIVVDRRVGRNGKGSVLVSAPYSGSGIETTFRFRLFLDRGLTEEVRTRAVVPNSQVRIRGLELGVRYYIVYEVFEKGIISGTSLPKVVVVNE